MKSTHDGGTATLRKRVLSTWRRVFSLSWPIAIQQTFNTLMRTVDILVTGLFSPAAVAAIGLADLYAQIPNRIGSGLGAGVIALSSQETGRGAATTRDRAITQAVIIGTLAGVPFLLVGLVFGQLAIAILGATSEVARMGGTYLTLVLGVASMRIVGRVGASALQGTGDTRTPMYVNVTANVINIVASIGLGLGIGGLPRLEIIGVGLATAISRTFEAMAMLGAIRSKRTSPSFARPQSRTITRQLVEVSVPKMASGLSATLSGFPFNAILLTFGTEATAAFHIGRRAYQQVAGPVYRSFSTAASIIVGQTLGENDPEGARFSGLSIIWLGALILGIVGGVLFVVAEPIARIATDDPLTIRYTTDFVRVFGGGMLFYGVFFPTSGALRGAGDTRTPFYARFSGTIVFRLGFSFLVGVILGYGILGVYIGLLLTFVWRASVVTVGFLRGGWADKAASMMAERAGISD